MTTMSRPSEHRPIAGRAFVVPRPLSAFHFLALTTSAVAVLVAASVVAWNGTVPDWEAELLRVINGWPDWLEPILWVPQQLGALAAPVIGGALIAWSARRWQYAVPFVMLVPLKLSIEWLFLKQVVERERPYVTVGSDIEVRGTPIEGLGFPSGHTTTAFAFAVLVIAFLPVRWRPVPVLFAVIVGVARLYAGAHNVLDVVAGAAVGTILGGLLWFAVLGRMADHTDRETS